MPQGLAFAEGRDRTRGEAIDPADRLEGHRTADAVGGEAGVVLEFGHRGGGVRSEDPVLAAGVEAESVEPVLEGDDIVTAQHGDALVEGSIAELIAGFDESRPGFATTEAVDPDPAFRLEGPDRFLGGGAEGAPLRRRDRVTEALEPLLEVAHPGAPVADAEKEGRAGAGRGHGTGSAGADQAMNSARSLRS